MSVEVGDIVEGRYRIIDALGEGGAGRVFLAEHVLIKRKLAVKILHQRYATDETVLGRFMNEARVAGTLGHPNIVESTDMGFTSDRVPYIAFEYLEGSSLTDEIYRLGGLPVRRALRIAHQIASALDAAHTAGIIHRDLKSDNIFLTDRDDVLDHVKVLDFGVSRFNEVGGDGSGEYLIMGTPEYMAPEQISTPELVDARTDIYGLGVILYEMIAGRCPFRAEHDPHAVLHQVLRDEPPPFDVPGLPVGLAEMIFTKLLAKDQSQRYNSMKDVAGAIEAFHLIIRPSNSRTPLSVPIQRAPTEPPSVRVVSLPPAPKRNLAPLWLVAAVLAGGAGTALLAIDKPIERPNTTARPVVESEAKQLATTIDGASRAAHLRAESVANAPVMRAGIETDAATVQDMFRDEFVFTPKPGEVLEVFRIQDAATTSWVQVPANSGPSRPLTGTATSFELTKAGALVLVVASPIKTQAGSVGGSVVLSMPIDLAPTKTALGTQTTTASLVGSAASIPLVVGTPTTAAVDAVVPLPADLGATLRITATIAPPTIEPPRLAILRFVLWGIGGLFAIIFAASLLRRPSRR